MIGEWLCDSQVKIWMPCSMPVAKSNWVRLMSHFLGIDNQKMYDKMQIHQKSLKFKDMSLLTPIFWLTFISSDFTSQFTNISWLLVISRWIWRNQNDIWIALFSKKKSCLKSAENYLICFSIQLKQLLVNKAIELVCNLFD